MNLVLLDPAEVRADGHVVVTGGPARHLISVLGVAPGAVVRVGLIDGPRGTATVRSVRDAVELTCVFEAAPPERPRVDLLLALPRPKVLRRLWAQLAALGVGRIVLTNAERVERNYFDTHVLSPDCYRALLIEGLAQARDTWIPIVSVHRRFKVLIEDDLDRLCPVSLRLMADPGERTAHPRIQSVGGRVLLAVGPEGGWNDYERALLLERGFQPLRMGPRTLRTDTACIALMTLVHQAIDR